ncbi:hypothetical protein JD844_001517 [Phrynosoma platyrhinos]|uniref:Uncharacterized protein n=1 Tax=Phrynosoma platyrhinos TaxID=52577 RepID=A0ABQ7T9V6_PHRPL|nr:hypothetical protein JD844_001517 [Phrynosoma platyrhinos]
MHQNMKFHLVKEPSLLQPLTKVAEKDEVTFPIANAKHSDEGIYRCIFGDSYQGWSPYSNKVHVKIRDASLSKPSIKIISTQQTPLGFNVTIECQGPETDLIFSLHKSIAPQPEKHRNTSTFHVFMMELADARHYACQYRHRRNPFVWSEPSDPLELVKRGSISEEANQPVTMPLEPVAEADPNEVSYAVLNHYSLKIKQAADPDRIPESCVYASVAKDRTRNQEEPTDRISQEW